MKKYLVNVFLFFGFVLFVDLGTGIIGDYLQAHAKSGYTKKINDIAINSIYDIMIMGSSRAHHHYDAPYMAENLGLEVYNAGYDGNGIILADGLLELMIAHHHPKLILYDVEPAFDINVYPPDNNNKRYISRLKPFWKFSAVGDIIRDVSREEWYKVHSGLIRYNSDILTLIRDFLRKEIDNQLGYEPLQGNYDKDPIVKEGNVVDDLFKIKYFEKFVCSAKRSNIPVIIIASPKLGARNSEVFKPIRDICIRYNVPFWDFYCDKKYQNSSFFKEPTHLNSIGARLYTTEIVNKIDNNFNIRK